MSVFISSDLHLGHKNIHKMRTRFSTATEHDEFVLNLLSETLNKRDKIILLGDNCFYRESFERMMYAIPQGCIIEYYGGNHDFEKNLKSKHVANQVHSLNGMKKSGHYWLGHYPIHPLELRGKKCVHGHSHGRLLGEKYINVCLDQTDFKLVQFEKLEELYVKQLTRYYEGDYCAE